MPENKHFRFIVQVFYTILVLFAAFIVFRYLIWWFLPFLIAGGIAFLIDRPVSFAQKHLHLPRAPISGILTLLAYFSLGWAVWFICTKIIGEIRDLLASLPSTDTMLMEAARFLQWLSGYLPDRVSAWLFSVFETVVRDGISLPQGWLDRIGQFAAHAAARLPSILFALLVSIIATYFISSDKEALRDFFSALLPPKFKRICSVTRRESFRMASGYLRAAALMLCLTFAELAVGLGLLRIRYAVGIAALVALLDAIPILGTGTALLPWALSRLLHGDYATALGLVLLYAVTLVVRNLVEPKILGAQIGLHPLITLIALYVGLHAFGPLGILLPLPLTAALSLYQRKNSP